jgi:hypothetical protein
MKNEMKNEKEVHPASTGSRGCTRWDGSLVQNKIK